MSQRITSIELAEIATVSAKPVQTRVERNFGLPTGIYAATVGAYLAFLGVMASAFLTGELVLPMVVFVVYIVMAFGVPGFWARMNPDNSSSPLSWGQFRNRGIMIESGRLSAFEASVQVLMLPALILVWGVAVAIIAATT